MEAGGSCLVLDEKVRWKKEEVERRRRLFYRFFALSLARDKAEKK